MAVDGSLTFWWLGYGLNRRYTYFQSTNGTTFPCEDFGWRFSVCEQLSIPQSEGIYWDSLGVIIQFENGTKIEMRNVPPLTDEGLVEYYREKFYPENVTVEVFMYGGKTK